MDDIKQAIKSARLPEKSVLICLRGDLVADYEATERELADAGEQAGDSLAGASTADLAQRMDEQAGDSLAGASTADLAQRMDEQAGDSLAGASTADLAQRMDELREQMREHTVEFRVRAMSRQRWREFIAEHEPRKLEDGSIHKDDLVGVNEETFYPALVRRSVISPELDDEDWPALLDVLTDRQFGALSDAAWTVNRRDVDVPFSSAASPRTRTSGRGSKRRNGSASR